MKIARGPLEHLLQADSTPNWGWTLLRIQLIEPMSGLHAQPPAIASKYRRIRYLFAVVIVSGDAIIQLSDSEADVRYQIMPRAAVLFAENSSNEVAIDGGAFALQGIASVNVLDGSALHGAIGPVFGYRDIGEGQWGIGAIVNASVTFAVTERFSISPEVSAVAYYDHYGDTSHLIAAPTIALSYIF